jgi:hypothetical protein
MAVTWAVRKAMLTAAEKDIFVVDETVDNAGKLSAEKLVRHWEYLMEQKMEWTRDWKLVGQ